MRLARPGRFSKLPALQSAQVPLGEEAIPSGPVDSSPLKPRPWDVPGRLPFAPSVPPDSFPVPPMTVCVSPKAEGRRPATADSVPMLPAAFLVAGRSVRTKSHALPLKVWTLRGKLRRLPMAFTPFRIKGGALSLTWGWLQETTGALPDKSCRSPRAGGAPGVFRGAEKVSGTAREVFPGAGKLVKTA